MLKKKKDFTNINAEIEVFRHLPIAINSGAFCGV
jgi:hypothetical protein